MNEPSGLTKRCSRCLQHLSIDLFHKSPRGLHKRQGQCKSCQRIRQREAYRENPERGRAYNRKYAAQFRAEIFDALGNSCAQCGYSDNPLGLEIDHIDEDGHVDRKGRSKSGYVTAYRNMLRDLAAGTARLQLLCGTCHTIKTRTAQMRQVVS